MAGSYPDIPGLPFAERILSVSASGLPVVVVDNTAKIDEGLADWNDAHRGVGGGCSMGSAKRAPAPLFLAAALAALAIRRRTPGRWM